MPAPARAPPRQLVTLGDRTAHAVDKVRLIHEDGGVTADFAQRGLVEGDHRRATRHRLEHREPEAFEVRRLHQAGRAAVELGELLLGDVAAQISTGSIAAAASASSFTGPATTSGSGTASAAASAARWFFRGCTAPTASTYVAEQQRVSRRKRGIDTVRSHDDLLLREAVEPDEIGARALRDGQHAASRAGRARDDSAEDEPVPQRHVRRAVLEGESWIVTTAGHGERTGTAYCVWTSAAPLRRSSRGSVQSIRSLLSGVCSTSGSIPAGTSSGWRVDRGDPQPAASSAPELAQQVRTYVSSPVRCRPSTSASTTTSGCGHASARR